MPPRRRQDGRAQLDHTLLELWAHIARQIDRRPIWGRNPPDTLFVLGSQGCSPAQGPIGREPGKGQGQHAYIGKDELANIARQTGSPFVIEQMPAGSIRRSTQALATSPPRGYD